jgi:MoaA/NifB/PqqE/SkfB family radical SAM enzyme
MNNIKYLNIEIIDICNLKCNICDIWKNTIKHSITIENLSNIFSSKYINKNTDITITWWEPLLYNNIEKIFLYIYKKWFIVNTLSTNWTLFDKLEKLLIFCLKNNIPLPNIHISIDWLEKIHDKQRWIKGSFKKTFETIIKLKKIFKKINIKIKYTISNSNINDINKIYILSKKIWVQISYKIIENDIFYTNKISKPILLTEKEKNNIITILKNIYTTQNKYINNLIYYINNNKLNFKCTTPQENLFIMANWDIFCCTKYNKIWNINSEKIDNIINNNYHKKIIDSVDSKNCSKCYSLHWSYKSII